MRVIVMGVSGSGKSTVGRLLAARLGCEFLDGDDFHPRENVRKMAAGIALADEDRWPWLKNLNGKLRAAPQVVLACSALKESYRSVLAEGLADCRFVHLRGDIELIRSRLAQRKHRYMPASLLESQYAALEPPEGATDIDIIHVPERCVADILAALR